MPLKVPHRRAFKPLHTFFLLTWHCLYLQKKRRRRSKPTPPWSVWVLHHQTVSSCEFPPAGLEMWLYIKKKEKKAWRTQSQQRDPSCPLPFQKWASLKPTGVCVCVCGCYVHVCVCCLLFFLPSCFTRCCWPLPPRTPSAWHFAPRGILTHMTGVIPFLWKSWKVLRVEPLTNRWRSSAAAGCRGSVKKKKKKKERAESVSRGKQTNKQTQRSLNKRSSLTATKNRN